MLKADLYKLNARIARARWSLKASHTGLQILKIYSQKYRFSIAAGDLLFFSTVAAGPTHVGIALGGDEFVHAPSSAGVVRVEHLSAAYWSQRFIGARRVTN